jgi:NAD(P)-dependent dehydrogenase (short-subunit alcohol dehydrogenase family)
VLVTEGTSVRVGPGQSVYAATKAAVPNLARGWAVDLRGRAIRVNALSPGPTRTPGLLGVVDPDRQQALLDSYAAAVPLGRVAEPEEIAGAAAFLASDDASFVNGIEFFVDGGQAQI